MIPGFLEAVKLDVEFLSHYISAQPKTSSEQDAIANRAGIRILAALGMAWAAKRAVCAFIGTTTLSSLAFTVGLYVVCHDVFVLVRNKEKWIVGQLLSLGKGILKDVADLAKGAKTLDSAPRFPLSEGTILRPFWDEFILKVMTAQLSQANR